jgi:hypothetical protein
MVEADSEANDDFGITDKGTDTDEGTDTGDSPADHTINSELERNKRSEELGAIEQANVAAYKNGVMAISNG